MEGAVYSSSSSGVSACGGGPSALRGSCSGTESSSIRERDWWELKVRYGCSAVPYKMRLHSFNFPCFSGLRTCDGISWTSRVHSPSAFSPQQWTVMNSQFVNPSLEKSSNLFAKS